MPATNALTTKARVKAVLNISASDYDTHIENIIDAVSQWVEEYCGRIFLGAYSTARTEYPTPYGPFILLKAFPIVAITSIEENGVTLSYTDDDTGDYRWERGADTGMVQRAGSATWDDEPGSWNTGWKKIKVIYKGGYANQAALPADLVYAVDKVCAEIYRSEATAGNITSETIGSYSVSYSSKEAANKSGTLGIFDLYKTPRL